MLDPAWRGVVDRMLRIRASKVYMPASLLVLIVNKRIDLSGLVHFDAFEPVFSKLVGVVDPAGADKAWEPFFHLSRVTGLWTLHSAAGPADFSDVPGLRPKGRARLLGKADRAVVESELRPALLNLESRAAVLDALADRLLLDDVPEVRRLVVVASTLDEAMPGLLQRARLAV